MSPGNARLWTSWPPSGWPRRWMTGDCSRQRLTRSTPCWPQHQTRSANLGVTVRGSISFGRSASSSISIPLGRSSEFSRFSGPVPVANIVRMKVPPTSNCRPRPRAAGARRTRPAVPGRRVRAGPPLAAATARRHHPVGPVHRRAREPRHARPVRTVSRPPATSPTPTRRSWKRLIKSTGFFRNKAKNIRAVLRGHRRAARRRGAGRRSKNSSRCPGVGRKTANVVLGDAFGTPGITVDTHVGRLAAAARPDEAHRPGEGRVRADGAGPAGRVDAVQPPADPARPAGVPRPQAAVRGVHAGRAVPEGRSEEEDSPQSRRGAEEGHANDDLSVPLRSLR